MTQKNKQVLLAVNNEPLLQGLAAQLKLTDYQVGVEQNGARALQLIRDQAPQLVIAELDLPGENGLTLTKLSRKFFSGGLILLSPRTEELDQVLALDMGADDLLSLESSPRLIIAKLDALSRRLFKLNVELKQSASTRLEFGSLVIDASVREAWLANSNIDLTSAEFDLLWLLASKQGLVVSREEIFHQLRGIEYDGQDRSIDVRISRIRPKIGDDPITPRIIKTVRAKGYMFSAKHLLNQLPKKTAP